MKRKLPSASKRFARRRCLPACLASVCAASFSLAVVLAHIEGFSFLRPCARHASVVRVWMPAPQRVVSPLAAHTGQSTTRTNPTTQQQQRGRGAPNKRTALKWVVQSIERFANDPLCSVTEKPSPELMDALHSLQLARTQRQVAEAGRLLESLDIVKTESKEIQERVIKACSISGLLALALDLLDDLVARKIMPSPIAYVSVCNSLRKVGRIKRLEELIYQLGSISAEESVSVMALNTFLAALCDNVEDFQSLEHARDWLRPGVSSDRLGGTEPDASSYSTVLNAAASMGNRRMVETLWVEMTQTRKLQPTIYGYNAMLRSVRSEADGSTRVLDLFDELQGNMKPDRYTIDLVLVPLIRAKRIGDVEALLGEFVESQSVDARTTSNAFAAFMGTLIKAGELPMARAIFDTYLLPSFSVASSSGTTCIRPTSRHFNLLIDGYKRYAEANQLSSDDDGFQEESFARSYSIEPLEGRCCDARSNARELYQTMVSVGIKPDIYTLTSMLGIPSSPREVTSIFRQAVTEFGVEVSPAVARSAITAYGNSGDPSSGCIVFDDFASGTMNARTWNALLLALARSAVADASGVIRVDASTLASSVVGVYNSTRMLNRPICKLVNGLTSLDAVRRILMVMERNGDQDVKITRAPSPNSQTFCVVATAFQTELSNSALAMELFRNATRSTLSADGRFINAIFRCFGDDIDSAVAAWRNEIRRACLAHEHRRRSLPPPSRRTEGKNLIASYHGLLYVCGRAWRPDIAVRIVYAMTKDGLEPNEMALNCYRSGKRMRHKLNKSDGSIEEKAGIGLALSEQFESILTVECTSYDLDDKRRAGEKRVRIII